MITEGYYFLLFVDIHILFYDQEKATIKLFSSTVVSAELEQQIGSLDQTGGSDAEILSASCLWNIKHIFIHLELFEKPLSCIQSLL